MAGAKYWKHDRRFAALVCIFDSCPLGEGGTCDNCSRLPECLKLWTAACNRSGQHNLKEPELERYSRRFEMLRSRQ